MLDSAILSGMERLIPGLAAVYVFGSVARGDLRPSSDIDLAIVAPTSPRPKDLNAAREAVELILGRDVDLLDLAEAPLPLARQVLLEGRRIHAPHAATADFLEVRILREYEDLKRRRAGIEADAYARGAVYAA